MVSLVLDDRPLDSAGLSGEKSGAEGLGVRIRGKTAYQGPKSPQVSKQNLPKSSVSAKRACAQSFKGVSEP